ncbi:hypothetical protein KGM_212325 [Danaus plexippus plexippus]|uniref:Uncharacterized protein n=1 Tax=Danaus plexippus plexippus TaxID=278856 RepID=A0A212F831_DANPL|nr:hypothetical protein KGM_212325 [Danaus plexippus plexippus]
MWGHVETWEIHDVRLNSRVDSMLKDGLIDELLDFHDRHNKQRIKDGNKIPVFTFHSLTPMRVLELTVLVLTEALTTNRPGNKPVSTQRLDGASSS